MSGKGRGIMHNKIGIFDKKIVVTGSYNWTENAEKYNYENAVFLDDKESVEKYIKEFEGLWNKQ